MSLKLSRNQHRAINALMEHHRIDQAAEIIGVNRRTLTRWMSDGAFRLALASAEGELLDKTGRRLLIMTEAALDVLEDIMDNPNQPGAGNRRLAAAEVLSQTLRLREVKNIEVRLADLEEAILNHE